MVDGEAFALYEILKDRLSDVARTNLTQVLLKQAGERYKHNHGFVERRVVEATKEKPEQMPPSGSVGYGLAFGLPTHAPGDRPRVPVDVVEAERRVIAPPATVPPVLVPTRVRTAEELLVVLKADRTENTLKTLSDLELRAKLDSLIRESVSSWRVNKEKENREVGTPIAKFEEFKLSSNATATLHYFVSTQTEALIPEAAKNASKAVYDARTAAERLAKDLLKDKPAMQIQTFFDDAAYGGRTAALKTDPREREQLLDREIVAAMDKHEITGDARTRLMPLIKTLEMKRFDSDAAWRRVLLPGLPETPPVPKKDEPKKDEAPAPKKDAPKKDAAPVKK
jgi:hypothetical protein